MTVAEQWRRRVTTVKKLSALRDQIARHGPWTLPQASDRIPTKVTYAELLRWVRVLDDAIDALKGTGKAVRATKT